jgi:hypothetical protein
MSGVFRNIGPLPPHRGECVPPRLWCGGEDILAGWRGGGGSIVRKTPDTVLYSIYVSTLCGAGWSGNGKNLSLECTVHPLQLENGKQGTKKFHFLPLGSVYITAYWSHLHIFVN